MYYNATMCVKNIIPGQRVTKEKLERAKELRRNLVSREMLDALRRVSMSSKIEYPVSPMMAWH